MPYPPISALPAVPSRNAPSTFSALMDAFLAAFPTLRTEINALAAYLDTLALATGPGLFQNGSAAAPGISWALDTNTGLFRPAADQIGFATGGAQRALLSSTALQLSVPLTGTAVTQSATDTTAGRMLKVGDAGLLSPLIAPSDIGVTDNSMGHATFYYGSHDTTPAGWPSNIAASFNAYLLHQRRVSSGEAQLAQVEYAAAVEDRTLWTRSRTGGAWASWRRVYDWQNILGTVSQSSGVPTGAVIERGSNANGEYVRFADGTQLCWHFLTTAQNANTAEGYIYKSSADVTWTFPATFVSIPNVLGQIGAPSPNRWLAIAAASTTSCSLRQYSASLGTVELSSRPCAIGRWF